MNCIFDIKQVILVCSSYDLSDSKVSSHKSQPETNDITIQYQPSAQQITLLLFPFQRFDYYIPRDAKLP